MNSLNINLLDSIYTCDVNMVVINGRLDTAPNSVHIEAYIPFFSVKYLEHFLNKNPRVP